MLFSVKKFNLVSQNWNFQLHWSLHICNKNIYIIISIIAGNWWHSTVKKWLNSVENWWRFSQPTLDWERIIFKKHLEERSWVHAWGLTITQNALSPTSHWVFHLIRIRVAWRFSTRMKMSRVSKSAMEINGSPLTPFPMPSSWT